MAMLTLGARRVDYSDGGNTITRCIPDLISNRSIGWFARLALIILCIFLSLLSFFRASAVCKRKTRKYLGREMRLQPFEKISNLEMTQRSRKNYHGLTALEYAKKMGSSFRRFEHFEKKKKLKNPPPLGRRSRIFNAVIHILSGREQVVAISRIKRIFSVDKSFRSYFSIIRIPATGNFDNSLLRRLKLLIRKHVPRPLHLSFWRVPGPTISQCINNQKWDSSLSDPTKFACNCERFAQYGIFPSSPEKHCCVKFARFWAWPFIIQECQWCITSPPHTSRSESSARTECEATER